MAAVTRADALPEVDHIVHRPVDAEPGWWTWTLAEPDRFNHAIEPLAIRYATAPGEPGLVRMLPGRAQSNLSDTLHGGATLTLIDIALFAGSRACGVDLGDRPVTLDLNCQFVGAGRLGEPTYAEVEVVRETGRLVFARGVVVQGDRSDPAARHIVASFTGMVRKGRPVPKGGTGAATD